MAQFPGLVDSHFHSLSMRGKNLDPHAALVRFFAAGGRWALDVAVDADGWDERQAVATEFSGVFLSAGLHPSRAANLTEHDWSLLAGQLSSPLTLALGEVGLDWYRGREHEAAQRTVFRRQLGLARDAGLPLIVHNRDADRELLEDLDAEGWRGNGIFHCFSSDLAMARQGLDRGFLLSFAGNVTYPSSHALRDVARWAPADRLLVETDSPYLSPQGHRKSPNEPLNAGYTAEVLAELRGVSLVELLEQTAANFARVMGPRLTDPKR